MWARRASVLCADRRDLAVVACASCHDTTPALAHIDANTAPSGAEACAVCHGIGKDNDVRSAHLVK